LTDDGITDDEMIIPFIYDLYHLIPLPLQLMALSLPSHTIAFTDDGVTDHRDAYRNK
jgi:hypothetical protein